MNSITFDFDDFTVQIVGNRVLVWKGLPDHPADLDMDINKFRSIFSTAHMLIRDEK